MQWKYERMTRGARSLGGALQEMLYMQLKDGALRTKVHSTMCVLHFCAMHLLCAASFFVAFVFAVFSLSLLHLSLPMRGCIEAPMEACVHFQRAFQLKRI